MKLAISNIGWNAEDDGQVYALMKEYGYLGLEIAPTRIFPKAPYEKREEAAAWAENLKKQHGFVVPSMQSIWFGRQEKLFGTDKEREVLVEYTKQAVDFAAAVSCGNLVFGCPKNRVIPDGADTQIGIRFFKEIGDYAAEKGTVVGMEANPAVYNTNYINDTASALRLMEAVDSKGFKLNLDVGTMICNKEHAAGLKGRVRFINHVHISEPGLRPVVKRELHEELKELLVKEGYEGFVSVEMGKTESLVPVKNALKYVGEIFGNDL